MSVYVMSVDKISMYAMSVDKMSLYVMSVDKMHEKQNPVCHNFYSFSANKYY